MAEYRFNKGTSERAMFNDYWELCQKFYEPEDKDEYWQELVDAIDEFDRKYQRNCSLAIYICSAYVTFLEEKFREGRR